MSFERRDHRPFFAWRLGVRGTPDADGVMLLPMTVPLRTLSDAVEKIVQREQRNENGTYLLR
jgi:hypothetical protein